MNKKIVYTIEIHVSLKELPMFNLEGCIDTINEQATARVTDVKVVEV